MYNGSESVRMASRVLSCRLYLLPYSSVRAADPGTCIRVFKNPLRILTTNYSQEYCPKGTRCEGAGTHSHKTFIDFSEKNELRKIKCWPLLPSDTSSFSPINLSW